MPQLDVSTFSSQLFWLGVCFLALYVILSYLAIPKITRVLEAREEAIEEKLNKASLYREQAEGLLADYEALLAQARTEAHQQYQSVASAATAEIAQQQKDFLDKLHERVRLAEQDLYRARLEASDEMKPVAGELAVAILEKLTGNSYQRHDLLSKTEQT